MNSGGLGVAEPTAKAASSKESRPRPGARRSFGHARRAELRDFLASRRGQVAILFSLLAPILLLLIAGLMDYSFATNAKTNLQDATDAAALAVSAETARNPNTTKAGLQTIAQGVIAQNYVGTAPSLTAFHVCAPVQNDCTNGGVTMAQNTVVVGASAPALCMLGTIAPMFCAGGGSTQTINASTTTSIGFGSTMQLNIVLDSSGSMIVGSTAADVTKISNWVTANWSLVKPGDPAPYTNNDNPPCAFACHDVGGSTTSADMSLGLTHAHSAGATTRFDVMITAAQQLIDHVKTVSTNGSANAKNTYIFNVLSFDDALHTWGGANLTFAPAKTAVTSVAPGLDTHVDTVFPALTTKIGSNGNGGSAASPLKFVILVTDGLQSDRNWNWQNCSSWSSSNAWNYNSCVGGYAAPIAASYCNAIKNNGVVLGVLETPYVPLTGQDPHNAPYEGSVRDTIYPGGNGSASVVSAALQACATPGYYFQAANSAQISTGFISLTDQFVAQSSRLVK
jgi:Flp pilus assembly protein TadG